ncbi:hypothetical protein MJO28_015068 [Puccinia striiformis f. sp. tritici]|uniref:Uncharacterized protein n=1 Tax=Puccinia striiformis f. sp. tritici TaxID=168172 RepID=A0ACC0DRK8_9BASI|nr:hypothetical protein MJO29_014832 [Puccinia striiformis f. sp. tritici]KAI7938148.1 hypothetical protein MJO28_015068 [Puccinia striiformis f. sp. tritici]
MPILLDLTRVIGIIHPALSQFKCLSDLRFGKILQSQSFMINELFNIIVDFPETMLVLQDLRICTNETDQSSCLVHELRAANTQRLLHPGADTQDVITQYILLMKALQVLDPPGVLLSWVAQPEENDYHLIDWFPDPVDAPIGFKNLLKDDIIKSLVTNYQNQDGFVKELQSLLASRLLAVKSFDVTQELQLDSSSEKPAQPKNNELGTISPLIPSQQGPATD